MPAMIHKILTQQNPYTSNSTACKFNHFPCSAEYVISDVIMSDVTPLSYSQCI